MTAQAVQGWPQGHRFAGEMKHFTEVKKKCDPETAGFFREAIDGTRELVRSRSVLFGHQWHNDRAWGVCHRCDVDPRTLRGNLRYYDGGRETNLDPSGFCVQPSSTAMLRLRETIAPHSKDGTVPLDVVEKYALETGHSPSPKCEDKLSSLPKTKTHAGIAKLQGADARRSLQRALQIERAQKSIYCKRNTRHT
mmetsp:Transcript_55408/g.108469  ORF Transcript_55408/g.108469 Transcript_55408/m.108469 type:complete len:194 (-) Transcript_55408:622-1203(-)